MNISSPPPSGHHYFDEKSLVCDGSFSLAAFRVLFFVFWQFDYEGYIVQFSLSLYHFENIELFQMPRLKIFIKLGELFAFISSNIFSTLLTYSHGALIMHMMVRSILSDRSLRLCSFFFILFKFSQTA